MIREINHLPDHCASHSTACPDPGRQQRVRRCPLQNVTVAGNLVSSVKVSVALTSAEVIDLAGSVD